MTSAAEVKKKKKRHRLPAVEGKVLLLEEIGPLLKMEPMQLSKTEVMRESRGLESYRFPAVHSSQIQI